MADLRRCGDLFVRLILATPTITSMRDAVVESDGECEIIVGLTRPIKAMLMSTCILPRYVIDVYLLWLGCRWLAATPSFGDLLLNAVALEFILLLKDTLYAGVVPDRNKRATQNTLIQPWQKTEPANYRVFLSSFLLILVQSFGCSTTSIASKPYFLTTNGMLQRFALHMSSQSQAERLAEHGERM